jgi:2-iminobutanoate/2-iminopropanoate deaminase
MATNPRREVIHAGKVPAGRARISQAIAYGDLVFVSGMVAREPGTARVPEGVAAQTEQVLANIAAVLQEAGSDLGQILKTSCYLADMDTFGEFNPVWERYFSNEPPARICVQARLGPGFLVEIDAVAARKVPG